MKWLFFQKREGTAVHKSGAEVSPTRVTRKLDQRVVLSSVTKY